MPRPTGMSLTADQRRDIELVLLGACMVKVDRGTILGSLPDDILSSSGRELVNAVRDSVKAKKPSSAIVTWLNDHGAAMEAGDQVHDALIRALQHDADRAMLKNVLTTLNAAVRIGDRYQMVESLKRCLSDLETDDAG